MARWNWDAARGRDIVRERGSDYVGADFAHRDDRPTKKKKSQPAVRKVRCSISDQDHHFGRTFSVAKPSGARAKQCKKCGKIQVVTTPAAQPLMVPSRESLNKRLARLEGRTLEAFDSDRIIRSTRTPATPRQGNKDSTSTTAESRFHLATHLVHEQTGSPKWVCFCTWQGSDAATRNTAQELHRQQWLGLPPTEQRELDIDAVRGILTFLRRR